MKFKKSPDELFILSFLQQIKLEPCRSINIFWDNLYRKYDKALVDDLKRIVSSRADGITDGSNIYTEKNKTLELSLDFTRFSTDLYRKFFEWFIKRKDLKPKTILDLGCDNGIVTCFLAKLFPDAKVIGIDLNETAISCANLLKDYLKLTNVDFKVVDINNLKDHFENNSFDIILSIRTLHEVIEFQNLRCWSINDITQESVQENQILWEISNLLSHNGEFISWERLYSTEILSWWIHLLNKHNLYTDLSNSRRIEFSEVGDYQTMPVIISKTIPEQIPDSLSILTFASDRRPIDFNAIKEYKDDLAELAFSTCEPKELLYGSQVNYLNKSGNARFEVWRSGQILLEYAYSNVGYRKLNIHSESESQSLKSKIKQDINAIGFMGVKRFSYESIEERDNNPLNKTTV